MGALRVSDFGQDFIKKVLYPLAGALLAHEVGVLLGFGFALNGDRCNRLVGCFLREACKSNAEAILLKFDLVT